MPLCLSACKQAFCSKSFPAHAFRGLILCSLRAMLEAKDFYEMPPPAKQMVSMITILVSIGSIPVLTFLVCPAWAATRRLKDPPMEKVSGRRTELTYKVVSGRMTLPNKRKFNAIRILCSRRGGHEMKVVVLTREGLQGMSLCGIERKIQKM